MPVLQELRPLLRVEEPPAATVFLARGCPDCIASLRTAAYRTARASTWTAGPYQASQWLQLSMCRWMSWYITRINLDADAAHRITLLATTDVDGHTIATIDGST